MGELIMLLLKVLVLWGILALAGLAFWAAMFYLLFT